MSKNYPLRNQGKPIYDPFANGTHQEEVQIGVKPVDDRKTYEVHRACGHCRGTGKKRDDRSPGIAQEVQCSQCKLGKHVRGKEATNKGACEVWGKTVEVYAFELTEAEFNHLDPNKKLGAHFELTQHQENRRIARILSDEEYQSKQAMVVSRVRTFA